MQKILLISIWAVFFFASCEDIIEVPDISNQQVELLAPTQGSVVTDSLVNFNWNGVDDAESYLVQIATPDFENAVQLVLDSVVVIDSTFIGTRISKELGNNAYEWRVRAQNSDFETVFSANSFSVAVPPN
ncbi:MAG: hypothetical protein AAGB24_12855 [Bacteroidota bacterium]